MIAAMQNHRRHVGFWVAGAVVLLVAGGLLWAWGAAASAPLRKNQQLWADRRPASYQYVLQISCFCPTQITSPVQVTVREGLQPELRHIDSDEPVQASFFAQAVPIEGMFAIIQTAQDNRAARLDVRYDPAYGYPSQVAIDGGFEIADDEISYTISQFSPLEGEAKP